MRLLLVRHGETDWNAAGRIQGCDRHAAQRARASAGRRPGGKAALLGAPEALYTSPLRRAAETAEIIGSRPRPAAGAGRGALRGDILRRLGGLLLGGDTAALAGGLRLSRGGPAEPRAPRRRELCPAHGEGLARPWSAAPRPGRDGDRRLPQRGDTGRALRAQGLSIGEAMRR